MVDKIHLLKHQWLENQCIDSGVNYLKGQLRLGDIDLQRIRAAACLADQACQELLGGPVAGREFVKYWWLGADYPNADKRGQPRWSREIFAVGPEAMFRVGLALAWAHIRGQTPTVDFGLPVNLHDNEAEGYFDEDHAQDHIQFLELLENELSKGLPEARELPAELGALSSFLWFPKVYPSDLRRPYRLFWHITQEFEICLASLNHRVVPWLLRL